jgi:hypothetical protein
MRCATPGAAVARICSLSELVLWASAACCIHMAGAAFSTSPPTAKSKFCLTRLVHLYLLPCAVIWVVQHKRHGCGCLRVHRKIYRVALLAGTQRLSLACRHKVNNIHTGVILSGRDSCSFKLLLCLLGPSRSAFLDSPAGTKSVFKRAACLNCWRCATQHRRTLHHQALVCTHATRVYQPQYASYPCTRCADDEVLHMCLSQLLLKAYVNHTRQARTAPTTGM